MRKCWVIPPKQNAAFVANMEDVLEIYKRPYNSAILVICMDEQPTQLIKETRKKIAVEPAKTERVHYEYERDGTAVNFMFTEPLGSWLNVAELELSVFTKQCLDRRVPDMATLQKEAKAWYRKRNINQKAVGWQFTTEKARVKLKRLCPPIQML